MSNTQSSDHLDLRQVLADEYNKVLAEKNEEEIDPKKESLSTIYKHFHKKKPTALCLSGGGIRSATFGLGVIQGLARYGLLDKFHYLSTVSGGGYIGSWLTAWIHREQFFSVDLKFLSDLTAGTFSELLRQELTKHGIHLSQEGATIQTLEADKRWQITNGLQRYLVERAEQSLNICRQPGQGFVRVIKQLGGPDTQPGPERLPAPDPHAHGELTSGPEPVDPEPTPIRRLRQYSNYLTPRIGLLSADTWTWIAIYLRNLTLNWLVLIPLTLAVLAIPKMGVPIVNINSIKLDSPDSLGYYGALQGFLLEYGAWLQGFLLWAGLGLTWLGVLFVSTIQPSSDGRVMRSLRDQKSFLIVCELPLLLGSVLLTTYWAWYRNAGDPLPELTIFVLLGIVLHCASWLPYIVIQLIQLRLIKAIEQLCFIALAGAAGGLFLGLLATLIPEFSDPGQAAKFYVCFATPALLNALLLAKTLFVGLFSRYSDDNDREWWARAGGWVLIAIVGWSAISALVMYGSDVLKGLPAAITTLGGISGVITIILGRSAGTPANLKQQAELTGKLKDRVNLKDIALTLAAPLFAAFLIVLLSFGTNWAIAGLSGHSESVFEVNWKPSDLVYIAGFAGAMLALGTVMAFFINVNKFSLHAAYRNRLIRAYLGASRETRAPNPFTGFDPDDNIAMHELCVKKPFHVVNMALNLVKGEELAWQQRKAESFTVTPLHAGSCRMCDGKGRYRLSRDYSIGDNGESISLGTAVAISGAAASPNMGYHSSPVITFLLTLFNARLGWWLGNPGKDTYDRAYPRFAIGPLLAETFGLTDDQSSYIYVSDGGHFENLGLYEMVLRRCRFIVLSDAGQDDECTFEDLGNAVRKIRIDLSIPIEMQKICIYPRSRKEQGKCCAIGTIKYSCVDEGAEDGHLLYLKPTFYGNEPIDIYNYAQTNKAFPHEPTSDQWFSESQLESYRMLGLNTVRAVIEGGAGDKPQPLTELEDLRSRALKYSTC